MSVSPRRPSTPTVVRQLVVKFQANLWGSLALCIAIHLSAFLFRDDDTIRFGLVILFFASLASVSWSFSTPFTDYVRARQRARFAMAGPNITQLAERYAIRLTRFTEQVSALATLGILLIGLGVAANWPLLSPLHGLANEIAVAGFVILAVVPIYAIASSGRLREIAALRMQLEEEASIAGVGHADPGTVAKARRWDQDAPVVLTGEGAFRAGGYDWRYDDFYKNAAIFGQSGTGKTVCVLNALLHGLVGSAKALPASGLVLDPKGDFKDKIARVCRREGRERDLLLIDPSKPSKSMRWNPLDSEDDAQELAGRFAAVMQIVNPSGKDDTFWIDSARALIQNLIILIRVARPGEPPSLVELYEAATSDAELDRWGELINPSIFETNRTAARARAYFGDVWTEMPKDTKATVRTFVSNMLGPFLVEPFDTLFAGRSDATLAEVIDEGRILYVHMPVAEREVMARVVSTFVKLEFYREVLRRPDKKRPSFFLCDEFQAFFTTGQGRGDADAFERTRQSNHANVVAFQNLNALLKQTDRREQVFNLLGNCAIKLFLRNTDKETNEYASELFGEHVETLASSSVSIGGRMRDKASSSLSGSSQYAARVKKDEFTRLSVPCRTPGKDHAETIAHLAARTEIETPRLKWKVHPMDSR
ncbi:MAG: type IV secretory system conjugative DNA transfer family protein [Parvularcula sp.]|jgi:type IV secretory pathway TraG/TraD family ATPase VirD4|nr:type IV secretory system conjugative DNA transfer family protein [Parvularcula sp.]